MNHDELRKEISEILVKWNMSTRQAAISEIMQLLIKQERIIYLKGTTFAFHLCDCDYCKIKSREYLLEINELTKSS